MADYTQPTDVLKRVRFFDGQFLQDQDFVDEQKYHVDRERRLTRGLGFSGIVRGLGVTVQAAKPYRLTIAAGTAIDEQGRFLVLPADAVLDLPAGFARTSGVKVLAVYRELATDIAQTGTKSARRWDETPIVAAVGPDGAVAVSSSDAATNWDSPGILLATVSVSDKGDLTLDPAPVQRAGLRLPGPFPESVMVLGDLGVGTPAVENTAGWDRVVDVLGDLDSRVIVRTGGSRITGGLMAHSAGAYGLPGANVIVGAESNHGLGLITSGAARLTVTAEGNVGVGATPVPVSSDWGRVLQVTADSASRVLLTTTAAASAGSARTAMTGGLGVHSSSPYGFAGQTMVVGTESGHQLGFLVGGSPRMVLDTAGQLGIGTTAVENTAGWSRVVDVVGTAQSRLLVRTTTGKVQGGVMSHDGPVYGTTGGNLFVGTDTSHPVNLLTNGAARLTVSADGNVGIGAAPASSPDWNRALQVTGTVSSRLLLTTTSTSAAIGSAAAKTAMVGGLGLHSSSPYGFAGQTMVVGTESGHPLGFLVGGSPRMVLDTAGQLGIGTTAVENTAGWSRVVDVAGPAHSRLLVRTTTGKVQGGVMSHDGPIYGTTGGNLFVGTDSKHPASLMTSGTARLTVTADGNVGVGATDVPGGDWQRVLQVTSADSSRVLVTTTATSTTKTAMVGGLMVHDGGPYGYTGQAMIVGTESTHKLGFMVDRVPQMTLHPGGGLSIGADLDDLGAKLMVVGDLNHLVLRRAVTTSMPNNGRGVFLELRQEAPKIASDQFPSIRIQQIGRYSIRMEGNPAGFFFKTGDTGSDALTDVFCNSVRNSSDERLKERIEPVRDALATVAKLRGVTFAWRNPTPELTGGGGLPGRHPRALGLIAQEVEPVLPEVVTTGPDGMKALDYGKLTALLIEAVKEQQRSIDDLRRRLPNS